MEVKKVNKQNTLHGQCRCCLAVGKHKDIMKEYYCNGIREVYFDIFIECFNLFLSTNESLSCLICSSCVQRLRDANSFRMMAISSERQLLDQALKDDRATVFVNVPVESNILETQLELKIETDREVKQEVQEFSDDDIHDDQLFTEHLEPSEEQELIDRSWQGMDLVEGEARLLSRFKPGTVPLLPTGKNLHLKCPEYVKHLKKLKKVVIVPKMISKLVEETERSIEAIKNYNKNKSVYMTEKLAHVWNAAILLQNSNILPFRSKSRAGFPCFYCRNIFENFDILREHCKEHNSKEVPKVLNTYGAECLIVYADVTDLKCTICEKRLPNIAELKSHLIKEHHKKFLQEHSDRVIPFKISSNNVYECQVCGFNFETFGSIERHMNVHFRNYVCKECGTGFATKYRMKVHVKNMHTGGYFPCEMCGKVFTTQQKHKNHVDTVHKLIKRFKCTKCPERFAEYFRRQRHMVEAHGVAPLQYKCNVCEKSFDRRYTLSRHLKRDHLEERDFQCELCTYRCFTNNELRVHMIKHTGERIFECSICKKSYARKKTLKEHMRIHNNDRRFACAVCGQAFVQKCSLKGHIKTHHVEYSLQ